MPEPDLTPRERTAQTERRASADSAEAAQAHEGGIALHPGDGEVGEWLSLAEAQRKLGVMSEAVVEHWAERGWLRSRARPDGRMEVLRADVLREKAIRDGLGAIGGGEIPPDELDGGDHDPAYTPPWVRDAVDASGEDIDEWIEPAEAQRVLGLALEAYVEYWAKRGWLRSRRRPDGTLEVSRADVMFQRRMREGLSAIGGRDLTPEELDELEQDLPGTLPWERAGVDPSR